MGDEFIGTTGERTVVSDLLDTGEHETVYNLRVAECHTYFVGRPDWGFSLWAHNSYSEAVKTKLQKSLSLELEGDSWKAVRNRIYEIGRVAPSEDLGASWAEHWLEGGIEGLPNKPAKALLKVEAARQAMGLPSPEELAAAYAAARAAEPTPPWPTAIAETWQEHQSMVVDNVRAQNPGGTVAAGPELLVRNLATNEKTTIEPDVLLQKPGASTWQMIDAKFSEVHDLTHPEADLGATLHRPNQPLAFGWIASGVPVEILPFGDIAEKAGMRPGTPIQVERTIELHVNNPKGGIDVRTYRPRGDQ